MKGFSEYNNEERYIYLYIRNLTAGPSLGPAEEVTKFSAFLIYFELE